MTVKTWIASELSFISEKTYKNPFEDVDIDVVFTCGDKALIFPAFWDGGNIWRVRFSLPTAGTWTYTVKCADPQNPSLSGAGEIKCIAYDGDLPIYKHGFLKATPNVRYFTYADGMPFFYLGDTHWTFATEEFCEPGEHAGEIDCDSHFKYVVDRRYAQGFNVYQSEPIGVPYSLSEGVFESDLDGFRELDRRFAYLAERGFVHANAQLLFPGMLIRIKRIDDAEYLRRLGRYWAARYAAYPCLWTLGQEIDNDFYFERGDQRRITKEDHPYRYIAEGLHAADAHKQPLTAHMEFYRVELRDGSFDGTLPSDSSFRNVKGHNFYAYQWSRKLNRPIDTEFAKDGWLNGQGKVCILYESSYENLWTKNFGARSQGWIAYLNGLYGYGYGCIDMWFYKSSYDTHRTTCDGYDTVSLEDKQEPWSRSIEYETAKQLGYMRDFFEALEWWNLIPRFDSKNYFIPDGESFYSIATDERNVLVLYFFNPESYTTGILQNLDMCEYTYQWFDPRNGEYLEEISFRPDEKRTCCIEPKPNKNDWVLLVKKK